MFNSGSKLLWNLSNSCLQLFNLFGLIRRIRDCSLLWVYLVFIPTSSFNFLFFFLIIFWRDLWSNIFRLLFHDLNSYFFLFWLFLNLFFLLLRFLLNFRFLFFFGNFVLSSRISRLLYLWFLFFSHYINNFIFIIFIPKTLYTNILNRSYS